MENSTLPNSILSELSIDLAISDSPFFHSSRQAHENIFDEISVHLEYIYKNLRTFLEDSSGLKLLRN